MADQGLSPAYADENKPTSFYLGREFDLKTQAVDVNKPVDYESKDLTTHGVVVGMTGSGKTGLCITLLEEAALDGIPCIMIDPKGDLSNLLLQFPELAPEDFRKWLNPDEAEQAKVSPDEYARQLSERWKQGLRDTGQTKNRIVQLQEKSAYRIYTPGSEAGLPLSILQNFKAPRENVKPEDLNQKIDATASALLGLTGVSSDPVLSREHILIARILLHFWEKGEDLDLHKLIGQIQNPPMSKVGALDLETFYKEKDRLKLAVSLNNILAAPSFSIWMRGDPLDLSTLLAGDGKRRQLIFSVAHLDDAERMFFITLLLSEVLSWTRKQSGSSTLRAILYFDEVFSYLPPHPGNPPTKYLLMTLLKQARAFGVGVLLATQNPVDLDYKALSNAGTWFIGKLQTERDKARLLDGLPLPPRSEGGARADKARLEKTITGLSNRLFLLHNVHRGEPKVFQTRWALSYLRGPMTREEIARLMDPVKEGREPLAAPPPPPATPSATPVVPPAAELVAVAQTLPPPAAVSPELPPPTVAAGFQPADSVAAGWKSTAAESAGYKPAATVPPVATVAPPNASVPGTQTSAAPVGVPADMPQFYLSVKQPNPGGAALVYQARVLGCGSVTGEDKKMGRKYPRTLCLLAAAAADGQPLDWTKAETVADALDPNARPEARWSAVPETLNSAAKVGALEKAFADYLAAVKVMVPTNATLKMTCREEEDAAGFRVRCQTAAWEDFQKALAAEKETYGPEFGRYKVAVPEDDPVSPETPWAERWLAHLPGSPVRRTRPATVLPPREQAQLENLEVEWHKAKQTLAERWKRVGEQTTDLALPAVKKTARVVRFGLAWAPFWVATNAAGVSGLVPAY